MKTFFKQLRDTETGTKFATPYAILFMTDLEKNKFGMLLRRNQ